LSIQKKVVIAAPVLARNTDEAERLLSSVTALTGYGLPVILADGGSAPGFVDRLRAIPGVTAVLSVSDPDLRMVAQVQAAMRRAAEYAPDYILYTEPDKHDFFRTAFGSFANAQNVTVPEPGIIVAARDIASFATFPAGQQLTESLFNTLGANVLRLPTGTDLLYGPLLLHADLARHIDLLRENVGWGWRPFLMAVCRRLTMPLAVYTGDLPCPEDQRREDDEPARIYRMEQMAQNVRGLALGLKSALGPDG
jgi:hypothetical protein